MSLSSEAFRKLLRSLEKQHEQELDELMQEIARLEERNASSGQAHHISSATSSMKFLTGYSQRSLTEGPVGSHAASLQSQRYSSFSKDEPIAGRESVGLYSLGHQLSAAGFKAGPSKSNLNLESHLNLESDEHVRQIADEEDMENFSAANPTSLSTPALSPILEKHERASCWISVVPDETALDGKKGRMPPQPKAPDKALPSRDDPSAEAVIDVTDIEVADIEVKNQIHANGIDNVDQLSEVATRESQEYTVKSMASKTNSLRRARRFKILSTWNDAQKQYARGTQAGRRTALGREEQVGTLDAKMKRLSMRQGSFPAGKDPAVQGCRDKIDLALHPFMIDPGSTGRTWWSIASLILLCYDIVVVPPDCFIGFPPNPLTIFMQWVSRLFWSLDLPLNFVTGIFTGGNLELRPSRVCVAYLRSWFILDATLVFSDWFSLVTESSGSVAFLPLLRAFRLLRMLRLLRVAKMKQLVSDLLTVAPEMIVGCAGLMKIAVVIGVLVHIFSCLWFALGALDSGWARMSEIMNTPFSLKYARALYWTITRVHSTSNDEPRGFFEYVFATCMVIFGFICMAIFVGKMSQTVVNLSDTRQEQMQQICRKYLRTRKVSAKLQIRLNKYLTKCNQKTFKQEVEYESEMLLSLPEVLRIDLNEEVRKPLVLQIQFFREIYEVEPRMVRMLCFEAITCVVAVKTEHLFECDVTGTRMLWAESGQLSYTLGHNGQHHRNSYDNGEMDRASVDGAQILTRGASLSEAALWTEWTHCGELAAEGNVTVLALEQKNFASVLAKMQSCLTFTIDYARHYINNLNKYVLAENELSDVLNFEIDFDNLHSATEDDKNADCEHFLFLSHYKQEAGTEATLMEESLEKIIVNDESHPASAFENPCFLDSSDLFDLTGLKNHVQNSHNLIVLLTPKVFSRPWCLIEVVTAVRCKVNLVPVEIQRPGLKFTYPDDRFYKALSRGSTLSKDAIKLLLDEGIELAELEMCVRQVFLKIALTFSPHKSATVRQAELQDILSRCSFKSDDNEEGMVTTCLNGRS